MSDEGASAPTNAAEQLDAVSSLLNGSQEPPKKGADNANDETILDADASPPADQPGSATDESPSGTDSSDEPGTEAGAGDDKREPITSFKQLAEAAGIKMDELYKLTIGFGDGTEPMKLGAMKDAIKLGLDVDKRTSNLADAETRFQNEVMRTRGELSQLAAMMPATAEQQERAKEQFSELLQAQQTALHNAVPKLASDADYRKATHQAVTALGAEYGVNGHEIDNLTDHRVYKMAMDFAALKERVGQANAIAKKTRKGSGQGSSSPTNKTGTSQRATRLAETAKRSGRVDDQVAAIAELLG